MKEKIYDINPPQEQEEKPKKEVKEKKGSSGKIIGIIILAIIIILAGIWVFSSAHTIEISIWPTLNEFSVNADIILATEEIDDAIVMESFEYTEEIIKEVETPSTDIGEKAVGVIRVFNKYSTSITLVKGTRFLSSTEPTKQFHTLKKISVPSGGSIEVSVIASEPGESYNIDPSTFSVPGLRDFSPAQLYYDVYGKSETSMTGGKQEIIRKIEEGTFEVIESKILEDAKIDMINVISKKIAPDYTLVNDSLEIELLESEPVDATIGQEIDSFIYKIKIKVTGYRVKNTLLEEFARTYIRSRIPENKEFTDDVLVEFVQVEGGAMDLDTEKNINISTHVYTKVDKDSINEISRGRARTSIERYIQEIHPDLAKPARVKFIPAWCRRSSSNPKSIDIQINY